MAVFTIADLHLSLSADKPMDVFGSRWQNYVGKIEKNWRAAVGDGDTVVIPGDVSWAMRLEDTEADFRFIDSLPGRKIIGKGNHDLWWTTVSKMERYLSSIGVRSVSFLHNNAFSVGEFVAAGTRGWFSEERLMTSKALNNADFRKLAAREAIRLEASLNEAEKLRADAPEKPIVAFLHFPPALGDFFCSELMDLLVSHGVTRCFFGHVHGDYSLPGHEIRNGVELRLVSADYLNFIPYLIRK